MNLPIPEFLRMGSDNMWVYMVSFFFYFLTIVSLRLIPIAAFVERQSLSWRTSICCAETAFRLSTCLLVDACAVFRLWLL